MDVYHGRWPCCNAAPSHVREASQKFYSSAWWNTPLVPRGTIPQIRPAGYHPRENSPSARVRWGAGAPAKAIGRGEASRKPSTFCAPKHASEPSRAHRRRRRIAGLQACRLSRISSNRLINERNRLNMLRCAGLRACRTVSYATSECRIKDGVIR